MTGNKKYKLIGTVRKGKETTGYVLFDTTTHTTDVVIPEVTFRAITNGFVDKATLVRDKEGKFTVKLEEGFVNSLTVYSPDGQPISNIGMFVLARVQDDKDVTIGFQVVTPDFKVRNLKYQQVLDIAKKYDKPFANAKIVNKDGKKVVSALKGNFDVFKPLSSTKAKKEVAVSSENNGQDVKTRFRDRAVEYFFKQVYRTGTVKPIKGKQATKYAKVAVNEYFKKIFPNMVELKGESNSAVIEALVFAHLEKRGTFINSREEDTLKEVKGVKHPLRVHKGSYSYRRRYEKVSTDVLNWLSKNGLQQAVILLELRNSALDKNYFDTEVVGNKEKQLQSPEILRIYNWWIGSESPTMMKYRKFGVNAKWIALVDGKPVGNEVSGVEFKVNTREFIPVDFSTPEGINFFGCALPGVGGEVGVRHRTVYGFSRLKPAFAGTHVKGDTLADLFASVTCFGDIDIATQILTMDLRPETLFAYNAKMAILAMHNLPLAEKVAKLAKEPFDFDLEEASHQLDGVSAEDKLFYQSGLRFSTSAPTRINGSWSGLGGVPSDTDDALSALGLYANGKYTYKNLYVK